MCYTCGCKLPYENHNEKDNLIEWPLKKSGQTKAVKRAGVKTAKENMLELLLLQKERGELARPKKDYN